MRPTITFRLALLLLVLVVPLALAQNAPKKNGNTPKYDVSKEAKLKGSVEEVKEIPEAKGGTGIALVVKTGGETVDVQLCPDSVLKEFEVTFAKGDQVEITGAKIKVEDKDVVLAREVVRGNNTLVLRDKQGAPVWTWMKPATVGK